MAESARCFAHSLSVMIFDRGPLAREGAGVDAAAIARGIASRLHLAPRFRQRLKWIPYEDHPVWVDDEEFNLEYHLRHTALPAPGSMVELRKLVGRLTSSRLDRSRPMWECWLVEGLEQGRFALIGKVHNCMVESDSGADLLQALLSPTADDAFPSPPPFTPRSVPSGIELVRDEVVRRFRLPRRAFERATRFLGDADDIARELRRRADATARLLGYSLAPPRATPLNGRIGPHRRFHELSLPLASVQMLHRRLGCRVHDVVLTALCGAVRRFLQRRLVHPASLDFRVSTPVQVPGSSGRDEVVPWVVELPIWDDDPARVLEAIRAQTTHEYEAQPGLGAQTLFSMARWSGSRLLTLGARALANRTAVNMSLASVPGAHDALFFLGAPLREAYGVLPLRGEQGMSLALVSYADRLSIGINADFDLVPDVAGFAEAFEESLAELTRLARSRSARLHAIDGAAGS